MAAVYQNIGRGRIKSASNHNRAASRFCQRRRRRPELLALPKPTRILPARERRRTWIQGKKITAMWIAVASLRLRSSANGVQRFFNCTGPDVNRGFQIRYYDATVADFARVGRPINGIDDRILRVVSD